MLRAIRLLVLTQALCGWTLWGQIQSAAQANQPLSVAVYNDAAVSGRTLLQAEAKASMVYRRVGVELHWLNSPASPPELAVRIIPRSRNLAGEIFGVAFLDPNGFGTQADVFYGNIAELSASGSQNQAELLGYVMAHEIGHLLLGSNSHSPTGIMRLHWDDQQLHLASLGQLAFDSQQSERLRKRVREGETERLLRLSASIMK